MQNIQTRTGQAARKIKDTAIIVAVNRVLRALPRGVIYLICMLPGLYVLWLALSDGLGREPIKALEHQLGEYALLFFILGLAVTPVRRYLGINALRFRRALGVACFGYALMHLLVWLILDVGIPSQIWADILKRPYILVGFLGFVLLVPLAVTSNDWSVRRLGRQWSRLHRLVYVSGFLIVFHYIMQSKVLDSEVWFYVVVFVGLVAVRLSFRGFGIFR